MHGRSRMTMDPAGGGGVTVSDCDFSIIYIELMQPLEEIGLK